jgi:predicted SAM-dependent methyltransferase
MSRALNLGCGTKIIRPPIHGFDEWVNLDHRDLPGVDCVHDIRGTPPIPYPDKTFDYVLVDNVIEHFISEHVIAIINDIDRVLIDGGFVDVIVPHALSQGAYQDPTHKSFWVPRSFMYWNQEETPAGGLTVGITANLIHKSIDVHGDMQTEAFITATLWKKPRG